MPTRVEFQKSMVADREKGIDGHNLDERKKTLESETLKKYNVQTLEDYPSICQIVMPMKSTNEVWDKHFGAFMPNLSNRRTSFSTADW